VIARVVFKKTEQGTAYRGINDMVYSWECEVVFGAVFVEIGVINAHSSFLILFGYKNWIRKPVRMIHFLYETGC
jgi:hypothetical protein